MKKLILLALAPLAMLAVPASAQTTVRTVERPNGTVTRTVTRDDGARVRERTVVRTDRDDRYRDRNNRYRDRRDWRDRRWRNRHMVRRCFTTWRHGHRVRTCVVRRNRY